MKAWRLHDFRDLRLDDVPMPEVKPGWVLVKVKVVQPSVTDVEVIEGVELARKATFSKLMKEGKPIQRGHEFCGEVTEVGKGVTTLKVGDRVSSSGNIPCGLCACCRSGKMDRCLSPMRLGGEQIPGAFAEYICAPELGLVKIPDGPTDNEIAALQPLGACVDDVRSAQLQMGDSVVVLGQGPMGQGCLQIAKLSGAGLLIGIDKRDETLELSRKLGADVVVDARKTDPVEEVRRLTDGLGIDVVFECAGGSTKHGLSGFKTVQDALQMVRVGGKVVEVAHLEGMMELDAHFMRAKSIRYIFPDHGTAEGMRYFAFLLAQKRVQLSLQAKYVFQGLEKLPQALEITSNKEKYQATAPAQVVVL